MKKIFSSADEGRTLRLGCRRWLEGNYDDCGFVIKEEDCDFDDIPRKVLVFTDPFFEGVHPDWKVKDMDYSRSPSSKLWQGDGVNWFAEKESFNNYGAGQ